MAEGNLTMSASRGLPLDSWREAPGNYRIFGGKASARHIEPHFHETYIIGHITQGSALVRVNTCVVRLRPGSLLLVNPLDIVTCEGESTFSYDVCYPSKEFMGEIGRAIGHGHLPPRFVTPLMTGTRTRELGDILSSFRNAHTQESCRQHRSSPRSGNTLSRTDPCWPQTANSDTIPIALHVPAI